MLFNLFKASDKIESGKKSDSSLENTYFQSYVRTRSELPSEISIPWLVGGECTKQLNFLIAKLALGSTIDTITWARTEKVIRELCNKRVAMGA